VAPSHRPQYQFADYVELEESSTVRHEFLDGVMWAMAGGSPDHARVAGNVITLLNTQLADQRRSAFSSDLRIRVKSTGLATYPDVTVVCGELELDPDDSKRQTVVNPKVIVEVLSPTTERYDRGDKLDHYKRIPSLEAVVLVAHDERRIDVWTRTGDGWQLTTGRGADSVDLAAIGCALALESVYRDPFA
jgi:Uma2 family endonuclease